jgi:hypothetical protein
MKNRMLLLLVSVLLLPGFAPQGIASAQGDPYEISLVKDMIKQQQQTPVVNVSSFQKYNDRAGDRIAIALLKIYTEQELIQPANVKAYLPVIREAFGMPKLIDREADKEPRVTLFLLHYLEKNVKDPELRRGVTDLIASLPKLGMPPAN